MVGKDKLRIMITIHKETKALLDELLSLHSNMTYSNLIEVSLFCYSKLLAEKLEKETNKQEAEKEKN